MKKLFAVLLALTFVLSLGTATFAADNGTITIDNAVNEATYDIYKMLDFTPVEGKDDAGIYTIVDGWADFFAAAPATNYFDVVTNGDQTTVVLKVDVEEVDQTLAKAAIAYAEEKSIAATETKTADGTTVQFADLALGYYAIDTSLGTLCALTNTDSDFFANEKNGTPDIDKFVKEDSTGDWVYVNDADIDQKVEYKSTITVGFGTTNYVMHDTMDKGLTFNNDVVVKIGDDVVDAANYTVTVNPADNHSFDVAFDNDYIAGLEKDTQLTVYYSATLNEDAYIVDKSNDNTVYLSYGEDHTWTSDEHKTYTYTWKMDVYKFTFGDDDDKLALAGAMFQLTGENGVIKFSKVDGAAVPTYRVDADGTLDTIETDANGKFEIIGLDEGEYELVETKAPEGYNKLDDSIAVVITSEYDVTATTKATYEINDATPATIEVENKTGGLLPETGGIGTAIFTIGGSVIMLAAVILLVSKKRMANFG
ncbi:MAG: isopeptide-forming domain-containing fimbrial protein [Clostridia bacterium]|nr:isopeptide-forming domain-containing fimbrial protein [Clostridia bacterium]